MQSRFVSYSISLSNRREITQYSWEAVDPKLAEMEAKSGHLK